MKKSPTYLEDRICLNVLANSVENAKECFEAAEGKILLGVLSKNYSTCQSSIHGSCNISGVVRTRRNYC